MTTSAKITCDFVGDWFCAADFSGQFSVGIGFYGDSRIDAFDKAKLEFGHASRFEKLVAVFAKYPGATERERVEAYVKEQGFTDADLAKFRAIMLEPK